MIHLLPLWDLESRRVRYLPYCQAIANSGSESTQPAKHEIQVITQGKKRRRSDSTPKPLTYPSPPERAPPSNQSHTQLLDHTTQNSHVSAFQHPNTEQQESLYPEGWNFDDFVMDGRPVEFPYRGGWGVEDTQNEWDFENTFTMKDRPVEFSQEERITGQGW